MTDDNDFTPSPNGNYGDRIRARRDARRDIALAELKAHIDEHFATLHARLDELGGK